MKCCIKLHHITFIICLYIATGARCIDLAKVRAVHTDKQGMSIVEALKGAQVSHAGMLFHTAS